MPLRTALDVGVGHEYTSRKHDTTSCFLSHNVTLSLLRGLGDKGLFMIPVIAVIYFDLSPA